MRVKQTITIELDRYSIIDGIKRETAMVAKRNNPELYDRLAVMDDDDKTLARQIDVSINSLLVDLGRVNPIRIADDVFSFTISSGWSTEQNHLSRVSQLVKSVEEYIVNGVIAGIYAYVDPNLSSIYANKALFYQSQINTSLNHYSIPLKREIGYF